MGDVATAASLPGPAAAVAPGPRISVTVAALFGFLGGTLLAAVLVWPLLRWEVGGAVWVVGGAGVAYAMALLVWARLWRSPEAVAAVLITSFVGLVGGLMIGLVAVWTAFPDLRPALVPA